MKRLHSTDAAILELLDFFLPLCEDASTMLEVRDMAADWRKWRDGHKVFDHIRKKTLVAELGSDSFRSHQYSFEEICVKTLYNLSNPQDPFDSDSSFWVLPIALQFATAIGIKKPAYISSLFKEYI